VFDVLDDGGDGLAEAVISLLKKPNKK